MESFAIIVNVLKPLNIVLKFPTLDVYRDSGYASVDIIISYKFENQLNISWKMPENVIV